MVLNGLIGKEIEHELYITVFTITMYYAVFSNSYNSVTII